jgi:mRNA-degrading endonuclease toxin of MazEF toxin-antitoxin module
MSSFSVVRGGVYLAKGKPDERRYVVVSNDSRNAQLSDVLGVRLIRDILPPMPTVVKLPEVEPLAGNVLCDEVDTIPVGDLVYDLGRLSRQFMWRINIGLLTALDLQRIRSITFPLDDV